MYFVGICGQLTTWQNYESNHHHHHHRNREDMTMATTIADLLANGEEIEGKLVQFFTFFNKFTGSIKYQESDGQIVACGCDLFGPCNVRGPAWGFEIIDA